MTNPYHATAFICDETGFLVRGAAGAGKTQLALTLVQQWQGMGRFARLIGDDQILLEAHYGRLIARPHPNLTGKVEMRGRGVAAISHEPQSVIHMVIDFVPNAARVPDDDAKVELCGVALPLWCFAHAHDANVALCHLLESKRSG